MWCLGLRYYTNDMELPGRPNVIFTKTTVAMFCDGHFWHGRDWESRRAKLELRWNVEYLLAKIGRNFERDQHNTALLEQSGRWLIRLWDTDIKRDPPSAARQRQQVVESRRPSQQRQPRQAPRYGDGR